MFVKRLHLILTALAVAVLSVTICYAESTVVLFQAYAWEQNVDVYVAGKMNPDNLSFRVSNQEAEVVDSGLLSDGDVTIRTTILLDISTSMPSQVREHVRLLVDTLIQNKSANEQYKLVVFGEQLIVLQDYTSDRYDLSNAANKIEFNGQQSKIYDAIYNTIPIVQPIEDAPCYYRTIVITDGIDDTATGVTREELYLKLQADTYPIDVVAVSRTAQAEPERLLSALTRMSNGRYFNLYAQSDIASMASNLEVNDIFWIRAIIPGTLLDGSTRQFNISDGTFSLQFDMKVPMFDIPVVEEPIQTEEPVQTEEPLVETPSQTPAEIPVTTAPISPAQTSDSDTTTAPGLNNLFGDFTIVIFLGVGVGIILAITIIIAVIMKRHKTKRRIDNTLFDGKSSTISKETEILRADSSGGMGGTLCIRLRNTSNPDQIWNLSLSSAIVIGRKTNCQVCIEDGSMSREQCKLYLVSNAPMVENISDSNITQLNGEKLISPRTIKEGDKIKCGRVTLMVDSLYDSNSSNVGNLNKLSEFVNV